MKTVKFAWIRNIIAYASIFGLLLAFEAKARQSDPEKFSEIEPQVLQAPSVRIQPNTKLTSEEVENLVADAYVHCFPIVENYKGVYFYGVLEASPFFTPMNTVKHETRLYTAADTAIVRANNDTFYSTGVLDLRAEPVIFKVPESEGRYYVFQLVSMTTDNFGYIGTRNTGSQAGIFAVTSPYFSGNLPDGVTQIKAPSEFVAVGGRTGVNAEDSSDIEAALALQSKFEIGVISKFYPEFKPKTVEQISFPVYSEVTITTPEFFSILNFLLPYMTLSADDESMLKKLEVIGVNKSGSFSYLTEHPEYGEAFAAGVKKGLARIDAMMTEIGTIKNGWMLWPIQDPYFGSNFRLRTQIARGHIYANCPIEAYYPAARRDSEGNQFNGRNSYTLTFPADQIPPAKFFWSLTMYDNQTGLMSHNELNRYSIGDRTRGLRYHSDGSLTIYMGHKMPKEGPSNWLPAPYGPFDILLRLYGPKDEVMTKAWIPQPVVRVKD
jgi:hypothetical protein